MATTDTVISQKLIEMGAKEKVVAYLSIDQETEGKSQKPCYFMSPARDLNP